MSSRAIHSGKDWRPGRCDVSLDGPCISKWAFLEGQLRIVQSQGEAIGNQECIMAGLVGLMSPRGLTSDLSAARKKPAWAAWGGFGGLAKDGSPGS